MIYQTKAQTLEAEKVCRREYEMKALEVYMKSDGELTTRYYAELEKRGPIGLVALNLFRAQKASSRAKEYRRKFKRMAYDKKSWSMDNLVAILEKHAAELNIRYGWKQDVRVLFGEEASWVLYVDLPQGIGQASFHSPTRGAGPDYPGEWDGQHHSADHIIQFCDRVFAGLVVSTGPISQRGEYIVALRERAEAAEKALAAISQENGPIRLYIALRLIRSHFGLSGAAYDSSVVMAVNQWIDAGMKGPVPWPNSPFFARWADESGYANIDGYVGFRFTTHLNTDTNASHCESDQAAPQVAQPTSPTAHAETREATDHA